MHLALLALLAPLLSAPAAAGSRWLQNDGYTDGASVGFQGGFAVNECWGSVYVPAAGDYPFTIDKVRMLVGGSTASETFTIAFYNLSGTTFEGSGLLGSEGVYITGSSDSWNEVSVPELKLGLPGIDSGNVGVAVCFEEHSGYPAIARDTDGMAHADRNYIFADAGLGANWYQSSLFGLTGDWIMRICISGTGVTDEGCSDVIPGDGGSGDTGTGDGGSADGGSTDGGSADGGADGGSADGGAGDGGSDTGTVALAISSITPTTSVEGEAVDVVIIGDGFDSSAEARIGGIPLVGQDVVNAQTIQGRTPTTLPVGVHDVEVVEHGDSALIAGGFEVTAAATSCGCSSSGGSGGMAAFGAMGALMSLLVVSRRRS